MNQTETKLNQTVIDRNFNQHYNDVTVFNRGISLQIITAFVLNTFVETTIAHHGV